MDLSLSPSRESDVLWMARALEMARLAGLRGEVPVGAVLVRGRRLVAEGHNLTVTLQDPTAHAEILVIRQGAAAGDYARLDDATLYVTLSPVPAAPEPSSWPGSPGWSTARRIPRPGWWEAWGTCCRTLV